MRDIIIDWIYNSNCWQRMYDCGEDMPNIKSMSNSDLLDYFIDVYDHP